MLFCELYLSVYFGNLTIELCKLRSSFLQFNYRNELKQYVWNVVNVPYPKDFDIFFLGVKQRSCETTIVIVSFPIIIIRNRADICRAKSLLYLKELFFFYRFNCLFGDFTIPQNWKISCYTFGLPKNAWNCYIRDISHSKTLSSATYRFSAVQHTP